MNKSIVTPEISVAVLEQEGVRYEILLPNAGEDYIQQTLLKTLAPYELAMLQDMRQRVRPGELVLDVGANVGNHTLYLAAVAQARVIAVEPNRALCAALLDSTRRNALESRVSVRAIGLGRAAAAAQFDREVPENIGTQRLLLGEGDLEVAALDDLEIEGRIAALKIDVEGMELEVLEGGAVRIARDRPLLYVECQDEAIFRQIAAWTEQRGYGLWDSFNATPTHLFLPAENISVDRRLAQMVARETIQDYRLTRQLGQSRREKAAADAQAARLEREISKLRARLEDRDQKIATLDEVLTGSKAEVAHLAAEYRKATAKAEAQERRAKSLQDALARTKAEFLALRGYAQGLEKKHIDMLESETWRATEPVRWILRGVKRRPPPKPFVPRLTAKPAPATLSTTLPAEPPLIGSDLDRARSERVVIFMATYPKRERNLPKVVESLLPQCDLLCVYLNEYQTVPACLKSEKIRPILGKDAAGDLKDNGKFYATPDYPDAYHVFADDDLVYPPDYVARLVAGIRQFGFRAVVGFHGTLYEPPLESYIRNRTVLPFYDSSGHALMDQLGTGTAGYHTSTFAIDLSAFETTGMADLWFAKRAAEAGVPLVALERPAKWLAAMEEIDDTLFRRVQRDESRETALLRERLAPALRQGPRPGMLDFLQALYAPAYLQQRRFDTVTSAGGAFGAAPGALSDVHFAIIVTGWNCAKLAETCFASIQRQIPGGYTVEIHVYDDGSDDETWRILEAQAQILNLKAVRGERNMGPAFARDQLLRRVANGDDICVLLDMDDQLLPHALSELERTYRASPDCWMTYGNWVNQHGRINEEGVYSAEEIDSRAYRTMDVFRFTHLRSFRRFLYDPVDEAHLKDANGEWLRYCSDVGLMLPIADQCMSRNIVALEKPLYRYTQYRATGTQRLFGARKRETYRYLRDQRLRLAPRSEPVPALQKPGPATSP